MRKLGDELPKNERYINYKYYWNSMDRIIVKVRINRKTKQKSVTIPKEAKEIREGDYVEINKVK